MMSGFAASLVRALHDAGAIALFGGYVFLVAVARRGEEDGLGRVVRIQAVSALAVLLLSGVLWLWLVVADLADTSLAHALSPHLLKLVLEGSHFGTIWLARGVALVILAVLLGLPGPKNRMPPWRAGAGLVLAAVILGSLALAGHAGADAGGGIPWHLGADMLHLLAAGAWLGALPPFAIALGRLPHEDAKDGAGDSGDARVHALARRFSALGIASVVVLVLGGLVNAWYMLGTPAALITTAYGRILSVKILLFLAMLVLAARNLLRHAPQLATRTAATARLRLRRNALIEIALGIAVLLAVGLLTGTAPAADLGSGG